MPILEGCTERLAEDATDMRGLWLAYTGLEGHLERIEQCGNRTIVTSGGIIHDFRTDGTLKNGSRDVEPPSCMNTYVSIDYDENGVMNFHPFGLPYTIVTRRMEGEELVWTYPAIEFIDNLLRPDYQVFEYGGGHSTLWWARRVARVITIDHDREWVDRISPSLASPHEMRCIGAG